PGSRPHSANIAADRMRALLGRSARGSRESRSRPAPLGASLGIVGSEVELARLRTIMAAPDGIRTVLVTGEEGVGKTRLIEDLAESAALSVAIVHRFSARDAEGGAILAARESWREGRRGNPHPNGAGGGASRHWFGRVIRDSELEGFAEEFLV